MTGKSTLHCGPLARAVLAVLLAVTMLLPPSTLPVSAASSERTLYLHHTHTGQTARFTFKRNGQYDQAVLRQMNVFLADWRTKEPTKMDPALFDLLWLVYSEVRASKPINIVSSYRSPKTNAMLAKKSSGVADNSQHMKGKAVDFYIPGVNLTRLREVAMKYQVGGVGFYPTSGSPFVHLDTGSVRAWPRMTRAQLKKVFPDGKTLHVPTDGKPLSNEGRRYAEAEWKKCHMVPCKAGSTIFSPSTTMVAGTDAPVPATPSSNLLDFIFGGGEDDEEIAVAPDVKVASAEPTQRVVETISVTAPVPLMRPGTGIMPAFFATGEDGPLAPIPARKSPAILLATGPSVSGGNGETALVALANLGAPVPAPRVHMTPKEDLMVTAYVPAMEPDPGAQLALQMIIERELTASLPPMPAQKPAAAPDVQTAALGEPPSGLKALALLMEGTWDAVTGKDQPPLANALLAHVAPDPNPSLRAYPVELFAPDIDHVAETMVQPVSLSSVFFGEMYEPEGHLDKTTELGELSTRIGFQPETAVPTYDRFVLNAPLLVAAR